MEVKYKDVLNKWELQQDYLTKMINAYDPHGLRLQRVHAVSRVANNMINDGFTDNEIYSVANKARELWHLDQLPADKPLNRTGVNHAI